MDASPTGDPCLRRKRRRAYRRNATEYAYDGQSLRVSLDTREQATNFTGKERDTESGLDNFGAR